MSESELLYSAEDIEVAREMLRPRVEKGIAYLDEYHPGWSVQIEVSKLEMNNCRRCIGGQLMDDYHYLSQEIQGATGLSGADLGFDVSEAGWGELDSPPVPSTEEYRLLEELWSDEIARRSDG
jgi:hypothetical protein